MTSNDRSPWAQIVLSIHEGHGLGTINSPLVIVASLNKNRLESDLIHPLSTKLAVEFVWEGEMKEVKRLKQANTSIKVECFTVTGQKQSRQKIGYMVLSLKQANLILRDRKSPLVDAWHKLMGVRPELKKSEPKLLYTLSLQEKPDEPAKEIVESMKAEGISDFEKENSPVVDAKCQTRSEKDESNDKKSKMDVSVHLLSQKSENAGDKKAVTTSQVQDIASTKKEKTATRSTINVITDKRTKSEDVEQSDKLDQSRKCDNELTKEPITPSKSSRKDKSTLYNVLKISLEYVKFEKLPVNGRFHVRIKHKSSEVQCTAHDEITVTELHKECNISHLMAELRLESDADKVDSPELQICDTSGVFASAILDLAILLSQPKMTNYKAVESALICAADKQQVGRVVAKVRLTDCEEVQEINDENCGAETHQTAKVAASFDRSLAEKIVEELEDWKEKQQKLFLVELKKKESDHLTKLTTENMKRRKEIEDSLRENANKYQELATALGEANERIKEVARQNEEKGRQLKYEEAELHRKFNIKLQELREASKRMEADVNHKLSLASIERSELVDKINHMIKAEKRSERTRQNLEEEINSLRAKTVCKEELDKLTRDLKDVEEKLKVTLESKAFYKAQWAKAIREVHRLKIELQDAMDKNLQRERLEVFKIKMSQQAKEEENELMDDRNMLKNLQKETQDFIMKKCSTYS